MSNARAGPRIGMPSQSRRDRTADAWPGNARSSPMAGTDRNCGRRYWVESDELWSANDDGVIWRGRPDGHPVVFAARLPGTEDAVVLLNAESGPRNSLGDLKGWPHLMRVRPDGTVAWRASAGDRDWWGRITVTDTELRANTWGGYQKHLDRRTGDTLSSVFTK